MSVTVWVIDVNSTLNMVRSLDASAVGISMLTRCLRSLKGLGGVSPIDIQYIDRYVPHGRRIGAMTEERGREFFGEMVKTGMVDAKTDYSRAYTLQFVNHGVGVDLRPN